MGTTVVLEFGPQLIGSHLSAAFWGMSCLQAYSFFKHSKNRSLFQRSSVTFLLALNTFNAILTVYVPFDELVTQWGNPNVFNVFSWSFSTLLITSEISNFAIRLLFARCVWLFSKRNIWVVAWIVITSLCTLGASTAVGILLFRKSGAAAFGANLEPAYRLEQDLLLADITGIFVANTSVTAALCYYLHRAVAKTSFGETKSLIKSLIRYAISSGLAVSLLSLLQLIFRLTLPLATFGSLISFLVSKLYFNSYLALLNTRDDMRGRVDSSSPSKRAEPSPSFASQALPQLS